MNYLLIKMSEKNLLNKKKKIVTLHLRFIRIFYRNSQKIK